MADTEHGEGGSADHRHHAPILFNATEAEAEHQSALQEERDKHRRRAEKFGTQYKDPGRVRKDFKLMMEARQERLKANHGFTTGDIDLFSEEEQQKRAARASRFQLAEPRAPALDRYRPDEELEARARRAAKFGVPYQPTEAVLMDMDLFERRREVGSHVERRPEAIYLYGVDVMGTRDVLSYFGDYGATFVEWLDDSSCNVLFPDVNSTKRALVGRGTPLPPEVVTQPQSEEQAAAEAAAVRPGDPVPAPPAVRYQPELPVPDSLADVANIPYVWVKGEDFVKNGTSVSLVYRMATVLDVRDMAAPKRTRELWKSGGGGGGEGRGRGGRGGRGGKRRFQRGGGEGGEGDAMDVDDEAEGPGDGMEHDGNEEDRGAKRQRGARGGQRHVVKAARQLLRPYGGLDLVAGPAPLPAGGNVLLDYTELEDEAPATGPDPAVAGGQPQAEGGDDGGEEGGDGDGGAGRGGWRGRGRGRGRGGRGGGGGGGPAGYVDLDLRQVLKARRRAEMEARQARARSRSPGAEGGGDDGAGGDAADGDE